MSDGVYSLYFLCTEWAYGALSRKCLSHVCFRPEKYKYIKSSTCYAQIKQFIASNGLNLTIDLQYAIAQATADSDCGNPQTFKESVINAIFELIPDLNKDILDQITIDGQPFNNADSFSGFAESLCE